MRNTFLELNQTYGLPAVRYFVERHRELLCGREDAAFGTDCQGWLSAWKKETELSSERNIRISERKEQNLATWRPVGGKPRRAAGYCSRCRSSFYNKHTVTHRHVRFSLHSFAWGAFSREIKHSADAAKPCSAGGYEANARDEEEEKPSPSGKALLSQIVRTEHVVAKI